MLRSDGTVIESPLAGELQRHASMARLPSPLDRPPLSPQEARSQSQSAQPAAPAVPKKVKKRMPSPPVRVPTPPKQRADAPAASPTPQPAPTGPQQQRQQEQQVGHSAVAYSYQNGAYPLSMHQAYPPQTDGMGSLAASFLIPGYNPSSAAPAAMGPSAAANTSADSAAPSSARQSPRRVKVVKRKASPSTASNPSPAATLPLAASSHSQSQSIAITPINAVAAPSLQAQQTAVGGASSSNSAFGRQESAAFVIPQEALSQTSGGGAALSQSQGAAPQRAHPSPSPAASTGSATKVMTKRVVRVRRTKSASRSDATPSVGSSPVRGQSSAPAPSPLPPPSEAPRGTNASFAAHPIPPSAASIVAPIAAVVTAPAAAPATSSISAAPHASLSVPTPAAQIPSPAPQPLRRDGAVPTAPPPAIHVSLSRGTSVASSVPAASHASPAQSPASPVFTPNPLPAASPSVVAKATTAPPVAVQATAPRQVAAPPKPQQPTPVEKSRSPPAFVDMTPPPQGHTHSAAAAQSGSGRPAQAQGGEAAAAVAPLRVPQPQGDAFGDAAAANNAYASERNEAIIRREQQRQQNTSPHRSQRAAAASGGAQRTAVDQHRMYLDDQPQSFHSPPQQQQGTRHDGWGAPAGNSGYGHANNYHPEGYAYPPTPRQQQQQQQWAGGGRDPSGSVGQRFMNEYVRLLSEHPRSPPSAPPPPHFADGAAAADNANHFSPRSQAAPSEGHSYAPISSPFSSAGRMRSVPLPNPPLFSPRDEENPGGGWPGPQGSASPSAFRNQERYQHAQLQAMGAEGAAGPWDKNNTSMNSAGSDGGGAPPGLPQGRAVPRRSPPAPSGDGPPPPPSAVPRRRVVRRSPSAQRQSSWGEGDANAMGAVGGREVAESMERAEAALEALEEAEDQKELLRAQLRTAGDHLARLTRMYNMLNEHNDGIEEEYVRIRLVVDSLRRGVARRLRDDAVALRAEQSALRADTVAGLAGFYRDMQMMMLRVVAASAAAAERRDMATSPFAPSSSHRGSPHRMSRSPRRHGGAGGGGGSPFAPAVQPLRVSAPPSPASSRHPSRHRPRSGSSPSHAAQLLRTMSRDNASSNSGNAGASPFVRSDHSSSASDSDGDGSNRFREASADEGPRSTAVGGGTSAVGLVPSRGHSQPSRRPSPLRSHPAYGINGNSHGYPSPSAAVNASLIDPRGLKEMVGDVANDIVARQTNAQIERLRQKRRLMRMHCKALEEDLVASQLEADALREQLAARDAEFALHLRDVKRSYNEQLVTCEAHIGALMACLEGGAAADRIPFVGGAGMGMMAMGAGDVFGQSGYGGRTGSVSTAPDAADSGGPNTFPFSFAAAGRQPTKAPSRSTSPSVRPTMDVDATRDRLLRSATQRLLNNLADTRQAMLTDDRWEGGGGGGAHKKGGSFPSAPVSPSKNSSSSPTSGKSSVLRQGAWAEQMLLGHGRKVPAVVLTEGSGGSEGVPTMGASQRHDALDVSTVSLSHGHNVSLVYVDKRPTKGGEERRSRKPSSNGGKTPQPTKRERFEKREAARPNADVPMNAFGTAQLAHANLATPLTVPKGGHSQQQQQHQHGFSPAAAVMHNMYADPAHYLLNRRQNPHSAYGQTAHSDGPHGEGEVRYTKALTAAERRAVLARRGFGGDGAYGRWGDDGDETTTASSSADRADDGPQLMRAPAGGRIGSRSPVPAYASEEWDAYAHYAPPVAIPTANSPVRGERSSASRPKQTREASASARAHSRASVGSNAPYVPRAGRSGAATIIGGDQTLRSAGSAYELRSSSSGGGYASMGTRNSRRAPMASLIELAGPTPASAHFAAPPKPRPMRF